MKLELISLATVKAQLGISDTSQDSAITAMIPIVSNDVRRILNTNFDKYCSASLTSGSNIVQVACCVNSDSRKSSLVMGQVVYSPALPDDTYVTGYNPNNGEHTLSASATNNDNYLYKTVLISQWPTISKMIWYKIITQNADDAKTKEIRSLSYGGVSKSFSDSEVDKKYNYPGILIKDLGPKNVKVN